MTDQSVTLKTLKASQESLVNAHTTGHPDAFLNALLDYTGGFYHAAIASGMKASVAADAVQHVEQAARSLHALAMQAIIERDGWKKWDPDGGRKPPEKVLRIRLKDGREFSPDQCQTVDWNHIGEGRDIAYYLPSETEPHIEIESVGPLDKLTNGEVVFIRTHVTNGKPTNDYRGLYYVECVDPWDNSEPPIPVLTTAIYRETNP